MRRASHTDHISSHTTRDLPCVKVSVEVQLGVSVCNFYIGQSQGCRTHSANTVRDSHMLYLRTVIDTIRCNIILMTLYHK